MNQTNINVKGEEFKSGCPPPPFYYKECTDSKAGRPPPAVPTDVWKLFGKLYMKEFKIDKLSSDVQMYSTDSDTDLKAEFKRLFTLYVEHIDLILNCIANNYGNESDKIKKLTKIYQNLMHILLCLRRPQTEEAVVKRLEGQLEHQQACVDSLKEALLDVWKSLNNQRNNPAATDAGSTS